MKSLQTIVMLVFLLTLASTISTHAQDAKSKQVEIAITAAETWLDVVDSYDYERSWDQASSLLKSAITKRKFTKYLTGARKPLGNVISRTMSSEKYVTTLSGAPAGEYVIVILATSFTNKQSAVETITTMKESDGKWRIAGYYIK